MRNAQLLTILLVHDPYGMRLNMQSRFHGVRGKSSKDTRLVLGQSAERRIASIESQSPQWAKSISALGELVG